MNSVIATLILCSPMIGVAGITAVTPMVKRKNYKKKMNEYQQRFPEGEDMGYLSVSIIMRKVFSSESFREHEWMSNLVRYEGDVIHSERIKELFWMNFFELNEKYANYTKAWKALHPPSIFERNAMLEDIGERCRVCYDLMVVNAEEQDDRIKGRTIKELELTSIVKNNATSIEVQKLLSILESNESTDEMKKEAETLLREWNELNGNPVAQNAQLMDMQNDLETIKRIISGKQI